jgi:hypothetical protein
MGAALEYRLQNTKGKRLTDTSIRSQLDKLSHPHEVALAHFVWSFR